jgi:hypothetical protein
MNCPPVVQDLYWKKVNKPTGVEYNVPYKLVQVPGDMGDNNVNFNMNRQWTNVRGYGNILIHNETKNFPVVEYSVHPWNR